MSKRKDIILMIPLYILLLSALIIGTLYADQAVTTAAQSSPISNRQTVIIDAGHGGVDGGASSCTGVLESHINLEISLRLEDLMHLLGIKTRMIRTTDDSIYTSGNTIAAKKVSDLKERVRIVNSTDKAVLVSIHQNYFADDRYSGAQVFYAAGEGSRDLANRLQNQFVACLNPGSNRKCKKADNVYLMQNVDCTAVLVECGFLSNHQEEALLRDANYQKKLCVVIAATLSSFLSNT